MDSKQEEIIKKVKFLLNNAAPEVRLKGIQACRHLGAVKSTLLLIMALKKEKHPDVLEIGLSIFDEFREDELYSVFVQICKSSNLELQNNLVWLIGALKKEKYLPFLKKLSKLNNPELNSCIKSVLSKIQNSMESKKPSKESSKESLGLSEQSKYRPGSDQKDNSRTQAQGKPGLHSLSEQTESAKKGSLLLDTLWKEKLFSQDISIKFTAISKIAEAAPDWGTEIFIKALQTEENEKIIASLLIALGSISDNSNIEIFAKFLYASNTRVRANAVEALSVCAQSESLPLFGMMLSDPNNRVRANAVLALRDYKYISTRQHVQKMINTGQKLMQLSALYVIDILNDKNLYKLIENDLLGIDNSVYKKAETILLKIIETIPEYRRVLDRLKDINKNSGKDEEAAVGQEAIDNINEEEIIANLVDLITAYTECDLNEKKKIIFNLRSDISVLNYNFLKYISKTPEPTLNSLTHMALRAYESRNFPDYLDKLSNLNIKVSKGDNLFGITSIGFDHEKGILQLNKDLSLREKQYKATELWNSKMKCDSVLVHALREDTQDMITQSMALGATLEKVYMCFYQEKFNLYIQGKKSIDSSKIVLNLKKERARYDKFTPIGELLWSINQPRYMLFLITSCNIILFLRDSLEHTRCAVKSISYDYIDNITLKSDASTSDIIVSSGGKNLVIPMLSSSDAAQAEELITLALS